MLREELKKRIEETEQNIKYEQSRGWEADKEFINKLEARLERLKQFFEDLNY